MSMMAFSLDSLYPILICAAALVIAVVVILFLSFVGTRETTYEEAIAEQKRKENEILLQPKIEKLPKEKKKKHPKKVKDKPEKLEKPFEYEQDNSESPSSITPPVEIIPPKLEATSKTSIEPPTKKNASKAKAGKEKSTEDVKLPPAVAESKVEEKNKTNQKDKYMEKNKSNEDKKNVEKKNNVKGPRTGNNQKDAESLPVSKNFTQPLETESDSVPKLTKGAPKHDSTVKGSLSNGAQAKPEVISITNSGADLKTKEVPKTNKVKAVTAKKEDSQPLQSAPAPSPSKKNKKKEFGSGDNMMIGGRLISALKDAVLTSDEIQTLIEILLNRQQEGEAWVKPGQKIDPLCQLKRQLQETEQKLVEETQLYQMTATKLKDSKLELQRAKDQSRNLIEKSNSLHQEHQNLQLHIRVTQDQHDRNIESLKQEFQQVQSKLENDHLLALKSMEEENNKLKHAVAHMEAESSERARLQRESEQWLDTNEQLQAQIDSLQQTNGELQQHICQLQQQLLEASDEVSHHDSTLQAREEELVLQLNQVITDKEVLQITTQSLQAENSSLHSNLVNLEKNSTNYNQTIKDLETRLNAKEETTSKCVREMELRQCEASHVVLKLKDENQSYQMQVEKLYDDLNKKDMLLTQLQEEVNNKSNTLQKMNEDFEMQRKKNNEAVNEEMKKEQDMIKESMATMFPSLGIPSNLNFDEWLQRFKSEIGDFGTKAAAATTNSDDLLKQIDQAKENEITLTAQVQNYQDILTDTEGILHKLQKSVETEEQSWKTRLNEKEFQIQQLQDETRSLKEQNSSLEGNLEKIKAAQEMQEKLKELESKLRIEEKEKRVLEQRIKEAENSSAESSQTLAESTAALAALRKESNNIICQKQDIETNLEKERKTNKDLGSQIVKLNSLVRIGQDSLKAEQELVKDLQQKLTEQKTSATNGSVDLEHTADSTATKK